MRSIERAPSIAWYRMKKYKAKVMYVPAKILLQKVVLVLCPGRHGYK